MKKLILLTLILSPILGNAENLNNNLKVTYFIVKLNENKGNQFDKIMYFYESSPMNFSKMNKTYYQIFSSKYNGESSILSNEKTFEYLAAIEKGQEYKSKLTYGVNLNINNNETLRLDSKVSLIAGLTYYKQYGKNGEETTPISLYNVVNMNNQLNLDWKNKNAIVIPLGLVNYKNTIDGIKNPNKEIKYSNIKDGELIISIEKEI